MESLLRMGRANIRPFWMYEKPSVNCHKFRPTKNTLHASAMERRPVYTVQTNKISPHCSASISSGTTRLIISSSSCSTSTAPALTAKSRAVCPLSSLTSGAAPCPRRK